MSLSVILLMTLSEIIFYSEHKDDKDRLVLVTKHGVVDPTTMMTNIMMGMMMTMMTAMMISLNTIMLVRTE